MRLPALIFTALFILLALASAHAGVYELPLPDLLGFYGSAPRTQTFEFGPMFSHINGISIHWSGTASTGSYTMYDNDVPQGTFAYRPALIAWANSPTSTLVWYSGSGDIGGSVYPSTQAFDVVSLRRPSTKSLDNLLNGTGEVSIELDAGYFPLSGPLRYEIHAYPSVNITAASLIIDATPVPEPSGLVALSGLLASSAGVLCRRRR